MSDHKEKAILEKVRKKFPDFINVIDGLSVQDLEKNLLIYAKHRETVTLAMKKDEELEKAQELVKELKAPYNETLTALKLKMSYLNILIDSGSDGSES